MSIYCLNNTYLVCDDCQRRDEFSSVKAAREWADKNGWHEVERGGGDVTPFTDHICDKCLAGKMWSKQRVAA